MNHLGFLSRLDCFLQSLSCDHVIKSDPSVLINWAVVNKFSLFNASAVFRLKTFPSTIFNGVPPCSICQSSDEKLKWNFNSSALSSTKHGRLNFHIFFILSIFPRLLLMLTILASLNPCLSLNSVTRASVPVLLSCLYKLITCF